MPRRGPAPAFDTTSPRKNPPTNKDRVLDRYAEHGESTTVLAQALGVSKGTVSGNISMAHAAGDPRVKAGDAKRAERRKAEVAAASKGSDPGGLLRVQPLTAAAAKIPDGLLIRVKADEGEIYGPAGVWKSSPEIAKLFGAISDGQLYQLKIVANRAGLDADVCVGLIETWTRQMRGLGVDLFYDPHLGIRLRPLAASA